MTPAATLMATAVPAAPTTVRARAGRDDGVDRALDAFLAGGSLEEASQELGLGVDATTRFLARRLSARR